MRWASLSVLTDLLFGSAAQRLRRRRRRRPAWYAPFTIASVLASAVAASATSVIPPSFTQLVDESETIVRGTVTDVSARWVDMPQGRVIKTFVTVAVNKQLKGENRDALTLEFLGGSVGADTMHVHGMPDFKVGDREILFVQGNGRQFCPLVRLGHGRYRVRNDASDTHRSYVARDDDSPLESTAEVERDIDHGQGRARAGSEKALTPEQFEAEIAASIAARAR